MLREKLLTIITALLSLNFGVSQDKSVQLLKAHQHDISGSGRVFLLAEAKKASFFMLGELHGEQEIPQLLYSLWPEMNAYGYHHIAAEVSPWAAQKLEFGEGNDTLKAEGLWTNKEAKFVRAGTHKSRAPTIWGCDMEEISLAEVIKDFVLENHDQVIDRLQDKIKNGYNRKMSPELLDVLRNYLPAKDKGNPTSSLYETIVISLKIDSARAYPDSRLSARLLRENLMKESFVRYYQRFVKGDSKKIMLRFGRNHLHRGFDSRGISTMGNFASEFAIAEGLKSFNVAAFAAGGQCSMLGETFDADERGDDPAFHFFWQQANYETTIFDLRPLRTYLHSINERTDLQKRLLHWANSYDAIICYKNVTPRTR
jgi:hypothetical protein